MPRGDRTGPQGLGPRTGRGQGGCSPESFKVGLKKKKWKGIKSPLKTQ